MITATTKAKNWKAVTAGLSSMVEEAVLVVTAAGIKCSALDPSHTEGIGFFWPSTNFEKYVLEGNPELRMHIAVDSLAKVVKRFPDDASITLQTMHKDSGEQKHIVAGITITDGVKKFDCAIFEGEEGENKLPKVPYVEKFDVELSKMEEMMDDCKVFGIDVCQFKSEDGKMIYFGNDAAGKVNGVMIDSFDMELTQIGFNFTFMEPVLKSLKPHIQKTIMVEIHERAPIKLSFTIENVCTMEYYLAPAMKST